MNSLEQAQQLSRTRFCWVITYLADYQGWDWYWEPPPWQAHQRHAWPSQWQKDSGTYLLPKDGYSDTNYHALPVIQRKSDLSLWQIPSGVVDFDYSWHPDLTDPPFVYEFGTQWHSEGGPRYCVPGAVDFKYLSHPQAHLGASNHNWKVLHHIDHSSFDWSWRPHPRDPAYIYVWGNQWWSAEHMPTVEYHVPGATKRKYMPGGVRLSANMERWVTPDNIDITTVDYSWVPNPHDPPYVYEFGTQWQPNGGACYVVPGATKRKFVPAKHQSQPNSVNWQTLCDIDQFDFSWHPNNTEEPYIYVFGNQHYDSTIMPTVEYHVPGATKRKYMTEPRAQLSQSREHWEILEPIDEQAWDWTWRPNPQDPAYVYEWGNQWNPPELKASLRYRTPGATQVKHMSQRTTRLPQPKLFECVLAVDEFDYSWEPNPTDPAMTYVFGSQWNSAVLEPAVIFRNGGVEHKYMSEPCARISADKSNWVDCVDNIKHFDYSWRPSPRDPAYIYVFGTQWVPPQKRAAVEYHVPGATERKYMQNLLVTREPQPQLFRLLYPCDFDHSWEPDPGDPAYIYVWGNQWWSAEHMPTVEYHVPGATERKYMTEPRAQLLPQQQHWHDATDLPFEFDRSWCPDPGDPAYIYVFGNQWWSAERMPTVEYHVPGATERKYMTEPRAQLLPHPSAWADLPDHVDASNVDFSWCPDPNEPAYIYHFGTDYQTSVGLTYTVPGAVDLKFAGEIPMLSKHKPVIVVPDIFYMDQSNAMSQQRFRELRERYPHIQKIRYVNSVKDTINRCLARTKQNRFWVISSQNVYSDFDFAWHPEPWQAHMTHVFGSQWNQWSDTFLVNRWEFERHSKWAGDIKDFPNLNFVSDQTVVSPADAAPIYVIDHGNYNWPDIPNRSIKHTTRFYNSYLETFRRLLHSVTDEFIWVISTVCDYTRFDFSWQPDAWQRDMLHVFASHNQAFGDTFYVPVKALKQVLDSIKQLEEFPVNFAQAQQLDRVPIPVIRHNRDSHVDSVRENVFTGPLALFTNHDDDQSVMKLTTVSLWTPQSRSIVPLDQGAQRVIVPRDAAVHVKKQLYDYPYVDTSQRLLKNDPLDIVFVSNGEPNAGSNWDILNQALAKSGLQNRVTRIDGVNGRVAAYHAAARASHTAWFFAVFAKLEVSYQMDWMWQPDRMQQPKHYIFHAVNPVTGLIYGHQALIAYNKKLVLDNPGHGLDFTLDSEHEVVPMISGIARYNCTPWMAWRTAFREVIKLRHSLPDVENQYRLSQWLENGWLDNGEWSQRGAVDALEFYESVNGSLEQLRNSYDWKWLSSYAFLRHGLVAN